MTTDVVPLRTVATAFLRRRPLVVAPLFGVVLATLWLGGAPRGQAVVLTGAFGVALLAFSWEAWRGRRHAVSERW